MQVRAASISGSANLRHHLAAMHAISGLHAQGPRLQVRVLRELSVPQIQGDGVPCHAFRRDRYGRVEPIGVPQQYLSGCLRLDICAWLRELLADSPKPA
jgi:hypothetical protein